MYPRAFVAAVALSLMLAASAHAGAPDAIRDCAGDGDLDHRYSNPELRGAIDRLPSDLAE
jgi:hypothetical protein